jgi:release factor glutamine methyltransferase
VAYILGTQPFWTLELQVSPDTLIPRPETELLVETALALAPADQAVSVIDLGTGSGAIALALASERPRWQVTACDVSPGALRMAEHNRDALGLSVSLLQSDWFTNIPPQPFDLIIANPPYIESGDPHLHEGDLRFEPVSALVSGDDGLQDIRVIARNAMGYLENQGILMLEHGYNQGPAVRHILEELGYLRVESCRDLAGHERVTLGFCSSGSAAVHDNRGDEHAE